MKLLKTYKFVTILVLLTLGAARISAQEAAVNEKGSGSSDMSYFSQEEMKFILGDKEKPWNYGRISISPFYLVGIGDLASTTTPYLTGFIVAFDHGIHHVFQPVYRKKSPFIPGLKFETAFNIHGTQPINSIGISGGLIWLFPINEGRGGEVILSSTAGMNFLRGTVGNYPVSNDAFFFDATLGYEVSFSKIFISLESRFLYIYDENFPLMGMGGSLGVGYRFPPANNSPGGEE